MAAPAYAHTYAAQPARTRRPERPSRPDVRVVRGQKAASGISLTPEFLLKAGLIVLLCFTVIGFLRVGIASAAYGVASEASTLRGEISEMQAESSSYAIQKSLIASPSNLRTEAETTLGMAAPETVGTITLSADVVQTDSAGNLSLSSSLAALAAQD